VNEQTSSPSSRREFLRNVTFASGAVMAAGMAESSASASKLASAPARNPNVLMICSDQFRADFVGANHANPSVKTSNLDALAARGTNFRQAVCNQPLCSPSRASFLTGRYATETKVWTLDLELDHSLPTVATEFKKSGYTTAFIGKWHISDNRDAGASGNQIGGWIPPGPSRAGFDDLWEGANVLELVSHPYGGNYWDNSGKNIGFKDEYRVDFITNRGVQFIEQKHDKPWLLFISQLEPHQQNNLDAFIPPKRYEGKYDDPFIPEDLRNLPGNWRSRLPGYYGCVQAIDDCVGRLVETLEKTGQLDNTIIVFFSDHGCTFRTRLGEYKRSPHEAAIRVPFIIAGPGFDQSAVVDELVSLLDLTPTLLDGAGIERPASMKGKPVKPLAHDPAARRAWDSTAYIQISDSMVARAIRTRKWTYCAFDPSIQGGDEEGSTNYTDFALYSLDADPYQKLNLVGRPQYKEIANFLREELKRLIIANGEPAPTITAVNYYV
jgi:arylsulfatase A-like enzyme